ncbi:MAG: hypothetical protein GY852_04180 [bacterium]|nr:hypothetical protein [bacterium]
MKLHAGRTRAAAKIFGRTLFVAALLLEPLACSRSDIMPEEKGLTGKAKRLSGLLDSMKGGENAKTTIVSLQGWAVLQKSALSDISKNTDLEKSRGSFHSFLESDAPLEEKYYVVEAFVSKYKKDALSDFFKTTQSVFGSEDYKTGMPPPTAGKYTYMQALAHGFAQFGNEGFREAVSLVLSDEEKASKFGVPEHSLASLVSLMTCFEFTKSKRPPAQELDILSATSTLIEFMRDSKTSYNHKGPLLNMLKIINPGELNGLSNDPSLDSATKSIIRNMLKR